MKIYIGIKGPVGVALEKVLFTVVVPDLSACEKPEEAVLIIVEDKQKLQELFSDEKFFAFFSIKEVSNLPVNARWIPATAFIPPMIEYIEHVKKKVASRKDVGKERVETGKEFPPLEATAESQHILVVDDKSENRQLAMELLNGNHFVTLAAGFGEGLNLIKRNRYDVVLTDCQMPVETKGSALSVESVVIGQIVHNGLFLLFHATKKGSRVAIVTDANHHGDWVSALFDDSDLRQVQEVNGQPVLLINYMGKRWDEALKAINKI